MAGLDKATRSDDILRPAPVLLHVELTIDDVLVIHSELELEHLAVTDESAVAQVAVSRQGAVAGVRGQGAAVGLLLGCHELELEVLVYALVVEERREGRVEELLGQLCVIRLLPIGES